MDIQVNESEICPTHPILGECWTECVEAYNLDMMVKAAETGQLAPFDAQRGVLLKQRVQANMDNHRKCCGNDAN